MTFRSPSRPVAYLRPHTSVKVIYGGTKIRAKSNILSDNTLHFSIRWIPKIPPITQALRQQYRFTLCHACSCMGGQSRTTSIEAVFDRTTFHKIVRSKKCPDNWGISEDTAFDRAQKKPHLSGEANRGRQSCNSKTTLKWRADHYYLKSSAVRRMRSERSYRAPRNSSFSSSVNPPTLPLPSVSFNLL